MTPQHNTPPQHADDHSSSNSEDDDSESGQSMYIQSDETTSAAHASHEDNPNRPAGQEATNMGSTWLGTQQAASQAAAAATLPGKCAAPPPVVDGDRMPHILEQAGGTLTEAADVVSCEEEEEDSSGKMGNALLLHDQFAQHPGSMLFVETATERCFMTQRLVWNREVGEVFK